MLPRGFRYVPDFLSIAEEEALLTAVTRERFMPMRVRGQATRRETVSYGLEFKPYVGTLPPAPPIPSYLHGLRERVAVVAGIKAGALVQALISRYPQSSDIGWHVDHPSFGPLVACVSLLGDATLGLRKRGVPQRVLVARRSLYLLHGAARFEYQHKVVAQTLRYSITLRPLPSD